VRVVVVCVFVCSLFYRSLHRSLLKVSFICLFYRSLVCVWYWCACVYSLFYRSLHRSLFKFSLKGLVCRSLL